MGENKVPSITVKSQKHRGGREEGVPGAPIGNLSAKTDFRPNRYRLHNKYSPTKTASFHSMSLHRISWQYQVTAQLILVVTLQIFWEDYQNADKPRL